MEKGKKCSCVKCQHSNMLVTKHGAWLNFMLPWITNNLQSYRATGLIFLLNWQSFDPGICHLDCWEKKKNLCYRIFFPFIQNNQMAQKVLSFKLRAVWLSLYTKLFHCRTCTCRSTIHIENGILLAYLWVGLKQLALLLKN